MFHSSFTRVPLASVSLVFHSCSTRVPLVFHSCSTRVPLVFLSCLFSFTWFHCCSRCFQTMHSDEIFVVENDLFKKCVYARYKLCTVFNGFILQQFFATAFIRTSVACYSFVIQNRNGVHHAATAHPTNYSI